MKTVSVHELRYHFPKVEKMLRPGDEISIVKGGRVIARLTLDSDQELAARPPLPDFPGWMRANLGDRIIDIAGAEIISADRDDH